MKTSAPASIIVPLSLFLSLLIPVPAAWAASVVQVPNAGFEEWSLVEEAKPSEILAEDSLIPNGYRLVVERNGATDESAITAKRDNAIKHDGDYSVMIRNTDPQQSVSVSTREIPVEPNTTYRVRVWLRGRQVESLKDGTVFWVHQGQKGKFWSTEDAIRTPEKVQDAVGDFDWMVYETEARTRPEDNLIRIVVQLREATGELWVDDLEITPKD